MNHFYRVVFNPTLGQAQAVPERARTATGAGGAQVSAGVEPGAVPAFRFHPLAWAALALAALLPLQAKAQILVTAGTLNVSSNSQLGSNSVTVDSAGGPGAGLRIDGGVSIGNFIDLRNGATLDNAGTLLRPGAADAGIQSSGGGATFNNAAGAWIEGGRVGVLSGSSGNVVVNNQGTIRSMVAPDARGVDIENSGTAVVNNTNGGVIESAAYGVVLYTGGTVNNATGSRISGPMAAVLFTGRGAASLNNEGTIAGHVQLAPDAGYSASVNLSSGSTIQGQLIVVGTAPSLTLSGTGAPWKYSQAVTGNTTFNGHLFVQGTGLWVLDRGLAPSSTSIGNGASLQIGDGGTVGALTGPVTNDGTLTFDRSDSITFGNAISGTGKVVKAGGNTLTLTGANSYSGGTTVDGGTLAISDMRAPGTGTVTLNNGAQLLSQATGTAGFNVVTSGDARISAAAGQTFSVSSDDLMRGDLRIGSAGNTGVVALGLTRYIAYPLSVSVDAGTLRYANAFAGSSLNVHGLLSVAAGAAIDLNGQAVEVSDLTGAGSVGSQVAGLATLAVGSSQSSGDSTFDGVIAGGRGVVQLVKSGTYALTLTGNNTYVGTTTIDSGTLQIGNGGTSGTLGTGAVTNSGTLAFDRSDTFTVGNAIGGTGAVNQTGRGTTILSGHSTYSGGTTVGAGKLVVNGAVAGDVQVHAGAALGGSGTVGGNVDVAGGATLSAGNSPGTLTIGGDLTLGAGSTSVFELGQSGAVGGASNDLVRVGGNLTLAGSLQAQVASAGWYRLFDYGGSLAGSFASSTLSSTQGGFTPAGFVLDTGSAGQVNLSVLGSGQRLQFWNGSQSSATGSVLGGAGTWGHFGTNWTDSSGSAAAGWAGSVAVFGGAAGGRVGIEGSQAFDTLQFSTDGYSLVAAGSGASLALAPATGGASATLNTDAGIGASIVAPIVDGSASALTKVGGGTLTLAGANRYSGGTAVREGTLVAAVDGALGSGAVVVDSAAGRHATLRVDGGVTLGNALSLANAGALDNAGTVTAASGPAVTGSAGGAIVINRDGGLIRGGAVALQLGSGGSVSNGAGSTVSGGSYSVQASGDAVTLSNAGLLQGNVQLDAAAANAVTLVGGGRIAGSLDIGASTASTLALDGTGTHAYSQAVSGATTFAGQLLKQGSGTWVVDTAFATGAGTTRIDAGVLQVGDGGSTGSLGAGAITNNATLAFNRADSVVVAHAISGSGTVRQLGSGILTLGASNSYSGGTALKAGTLAVANSNALGSGTLSMDDGTTLAFAADGLSLANPIVLTGVNDPVIDTAAYTATLGGGIGGAADLTKTGSGTLILGAANNTYSGATTVAAGTLQAAAENAFSAASRIVVAKGASLDLAGYSQRVAGVTNSGSVNLAGSAPGTVLTVTGPWVGQGGLLALGTQLGGDGSPSDKLMLSGSAAVASGSTRVRVTNLGGLGGQTSGNGIALVATEGGASIQGHAFSLADPVSAGAYDYHLNTTPAGAYLSSTLIAVDKPAAPVDDEVPTYRPETALFAAMPGQLRQVDLAMLGNLHQRVGDDGVSGASTAIGAASGWRQAWGRILSVDPDMRQGGTVSPESHGRLTGLQAGTDLWATADARVGLYVGQLEGGMDVSGFVRGVAGTAAGSNDLRSQYLAAYATWKSAAGLYVDGVLQGARHDYTASPDGAASSGGKAGSQLASIEVGQSFPVAAGWVVEPQLQVVGQRLSMDDTRISGALVQHDADDGWTARAGVRVKGEFQSGAGTVQPYGRLNVYRRSSGTDLTRFIGPAATADIATPTGGTSSELAAGATWQAGPGISVYGEVGKLWASGGDARIGSGVNAGVGVKVRW